MLVWGMLQTGLLLASLFMLPLQVRSAVCSPTAATLCVGIDDIADVWINGQCVASCLGDFSYISAASGTPVACLSINPAILSPTGANSVAVRVRDTAPTEMWGTWSLDITCSDGGHAFASSADSNIQIYYDPNGSAPPPPLGGFEWYQTSYVPAPAWTNPVVVTASVAGKPAQNAQTGLVLTPLSWAATGSGNGSGRLYFRQGFQLTPQPTRTPSATRTTTPTMTVTSSNTLTPSPTLSRSPTATFTDSPTITVSPTISPTHSITPTHSISPTITQTFTPFLHKGLLDYRAIYPTPFSERATIVYALGEDSELRLGIYNVAGELMISRREKQLRGMRSLEWKGENESGGRCASGIYLIHLEAMSNAGQNESFWATAVIAR